MDENKTMVPFASINYGTVNGYPGSAYIQIMRMSLEELATFKICTIADGRSTKLNATINAYKIPEGRFPLDENIVISVFIHDTVAEMNETVINMVNKTCEAYGVYHIVCCNWVG